MTTPLATPLVMPWGTLLARVPEGWTRVTYDGRAYGLSRTTRAGGRSVAVRAEELGGADVVSTNLYRTSAGWQLRPCEMPAEKVLAFMGGWRGREGATACRPGAGESVLPLRVVVPLLVALLHLVQRT